MSYITIQIFENSSIFAQNKKIYPEVFINQSGKFCDVKF